MLIRKYGADNGFEPLILVIVYLIVYNIVSNLKLRLLDSNQQFQKCQKLLCDHHTEPQFATTFPHVSS